MSFWSSLVEALRAVMLATGTWLGGSSGLGIFVVTFVARAAVIPVLLPLAIRTRDRQVVVRCIRPQIKAIHKEFKDDPGGLSRELKRVHEENGIKVVDWPGAIAALIQVVILIAFFQAVLRISEARSLAAEGIFLGVVAGGFSAFGTKVSGQSEGATWVLWLSGVLPLAISIWLGAGVGLYLTAFYGASCVQAVLMRREKPAASGA